MLWNRGSSNGVPQCIFLESHNVYFCEEIRKMLSGQLFTWSYVSANRDGPEAVCRWHQDPFLMLGIIQIVQPASVAQDWRPGGRGFNPRRGRQHFFVEIDREIFSTIILSLPLIQEGQLSVSGERMRTILVNRLGD